MIGDGNFKKDPRVVDLGANPEKNADISAYTKFIKPKKEKPKAIPVSDVKLHNYSEKASLLVKIAWKRKF